MLNNLRIGVVLPAYNAEATLARTLAELDRSVIDEVVLVDDASTDRTVELAHRLGLEPIRHENNLGYGGNQKTCYRRVLELGADVIVDGASGLPVLASARSGDGVDDRLR